MMLFKSIQSPSRPIRLFLSLCYLLLCLVLPFQHEHPILSTAVCENCSTATQGEDGERLAASTSIKSVTSCNACEWESTLVSPALPQLTHDLLLFSEKIVLFEESNQPLTRIHLSSARAPPSGFHA
jgi:hypothetical protein